ncbi:hypothetical protein [Nannocystis bainbridge]|uniref:HTH cro/C1-type domain-containing protein n=1 Tax=Nannocystis bainbridge TaxID=2995303 RepID=A0ABT5DRF0_9BACT|nr:hypothetical protein [Nannocystis bainbridge]MDC0716121.1 hypothetical protein [Nannocystis bainbridge]
MTVGMWVSEIRARAEARGLSLADLARAAEMRPSNLRRLLTSSSSSPRLGTMMRLMEPLDSWVAPAAARTAAELVAFLDSERERGGLGWDELVAGSDTTASTFARQRSEAPEQLPLDVVLDLAGRLGIELFLVDARDARATESREQESRGKQRTRTSGASRTRHAGVRPARESEPASIDREPATTPPLVATVTTPSKSEPAPARSRWSLSPPKLGRYRDAPPESAALPRGPAATYTPREPSYALERTLLLNLADTTGATWRTLYQGLFRFVTGARDVPADIIDRLANGTERLFQRLRRTPPSHSEQEAQAAVSFEDADPSPLIEFWMASKTAPHARGTSTVHDPAGRAHVIHAALSRTYNVIIRLSQGGRPHRLARIVEVVDGEATVIADPDVRLDLAVGDELRAFEHIHAGPVFGELRLGDRIYLLGALSWAIALLEVDSTGARVVWAGPAEKFGEVTVEPASPPTVEAESVEPDREARAKANQLEAELAAARLALTDERAQRADAQRRADDAAEQAAQDATAQHQALSLENAELRREFAAAVERLDAQLAEIRADAGAHGKDRQILMATFAEIRQRAEAIADQHKTELAELHGRLAELTVREAALLDTQKGLEIENAALRQQCVDRHSGRASRLPEEDGLPTDDSKASMDFAPIDGPLSNLEAERAAPPTKPRSAKSLSRRWHR